MTGNLLRARVSRSRGDRFGLLQCAGTTTRIAGLRTILPDHRVAHLFQQVVILGNRFVDRLIREAGVSPGAKRSRLDRHEVNALSRNLIA